MKILRFFCKCAAVLILLFFILWAIILGTLQTEPGQKWAFKQIIGYLEEKTEKEIHINAFSFSFPLHLTLEGISIVQEDRPLLTIQHLDLSLAYMQLLRGRIVFSKVYVKDINILNPSLISSSTTPNESSSSWETTPLPLYVKFENIAIQNIRLSEPIIDSFNLPQHIAPILKQAKTNLNGIISNNPFKSAIDAHLLITMQSDLVNLAPLSIGLDTQNHQLSLSLHMNQCPLHLFQLDCPPDVFAHLSLYASAPVSIWQKFAQDPSFHNDPIEGHFKLTFNASPQDDNLFSTIIDRQTVVKSHYFLNSMQAIELVDLKIENPHLFLTGEALINSDQMIDHAHFQGEIHRLEHFHRWIGEEIQGKVSLDLQASGAWLSPSLILQMKSPSLLIAQRRFQNIHAVVQNDPQFQYDRGSFTISFDHQDLPWKLTSGWNWSNPHELILSHLQIDAMRSHFQGEMKCLLPEKIWDGFLETNLDHFKDLSDLLSTPIEGTGQFKLQFTPVTNADHQKQQGIQAELIANSVHWTDWKVQHLTLHAHVNSLKEPLGGTVEFAMNHIETQGIHLDELIGATTVYPSVLKGPFHLQGKGKWKEDVFFTMDGNWNGQQEALEIQVSQLNGRYGPFPLHLKQPAHLIRQAQKISLAPISIQFGEAEIQGEFQLDQDRVSSEFKTNAIPSELFRFVIPELPLAGKATFQGHLEGTLDHPKGAFQIDLQQVQILEDIFAKKPSMTGQLLLNLNEKHLQLRSHLNGIGQSPLLISGYVPLDVKLHPMSFNVDSHSPFELSFHAEGELDPYLHLFYNHTANLSGQTKMHLKLSGNIDQPQMRGSIDLINGAYESLSTGALYHHIQAHLEGDGSKIILTKLSAQDNKQGQISATGSIALDPHQHFPFEFHIYPSRMFIVDTDYVDISASGTLALVGNTEKSTLQGELTVDQASIDLEETLPHQIKTIDIQYVNVDQNQTHSRLLDKHEASFPLDLDVKLNAQRMSIQGNHLKSQWKGALTITGSPENAQLHGDLHVVKGEYDFNGKIFHLSQGNIHFAGPVDKKTSLYIVASKEIDRITAEIIVKGPAKKPVISFRSNPPLSQREVLSYILFNRGISDITPDQGEQLSQSFISLNSNDQTKSNSDFLSRLRNNIGIDRLDFTTNDNGGNKDFGLQVGKRITENLTVSVNQSMTSLSPVISVEANLRKNVKAEAQAGVAGDAPIRMSIKWKKDY